MKKIIFIAVFTLLNFFSYAKKEVNWSMPEGELSAVFECLKDGKKTEILRIYESGQYEHLLFEVKSGNKEIVLRNLGIYQKHGRKITFLNPSFKSFNGKFKYGTFFQKEHLYFKRADALISRKKPAFSNSSIAHYRKPFFLCLSNDVVVYNREAPNEIDLSVLVAYLIEGKENDSEKIDAIEAFIVRSIEYDYVGFESGVFTHDQMDIASFIAGQNRVAICSGYTHALTVFSEMAGIEIQEVIGYTRSDFSELSKLNNYHVWSKILLDGEFQLHDLTWADFGEDIDYTWIDVRPEILISSHFPNRMEDQLLEVPIDQVAFLKSACIIPDSQGAKLVHAPIPANVFVNKTVTVSFLKNSKVSIYKIAEEILDEPLSFEAVIPQKELILFPVSDYHCSHTADSTTYTMDLNSFINVFYIEVNDAYSIKFIAVNGTEKELLRTYAETPDNEHYENYLKGILASIKLKDYEQLKLIAGSKNALFFDTKGQFKMKDTFRQTIENWDGTISELVVLENSAFEKNQDGELTERKWSSYFVEIPHGLKFTLEMVDGHYTVASIE